MPSPRELSPPRELALVTPIRPRLRYALECAMLENFVGHWHAYCRLSRIGGRNFGAVVIPAAPPWHHVCSSMGRERVLRLLPPFGVAAWAGVLCPSDVRSVPPGDSSRTVSFCIGALFGLRTTRGVCGMRPGTFVRRQTAGSFVCGSNRRMHSGSELLGSIGTLRGRQSPETSSTRATLRRCF